MSYTTHNNALHPSFQESYTQWQRAFRALGALFDSPSGDGYLRQVTIGGKILTFSAEVLPLNSAAAHFLARDKLSTYQILGKNKITIPKGFPFFGDTKEETMTRIPTALSVHSLSTRLHHEFALLSAHAGAVILKPGRSSRGMDVYRCTTIDEALTVTQKVLRTCHYGIVQEYIPDPEYRVIMLDDVPILVYQKIPATPESVTYNLSQGAATHIIKDPPADILNAARRAHHALGLRISGIDIRRPREGESIVLELNANPVFTHFARLHDDIAEMVVKKIARKIIEEMVMQKLRM